MNGNDRCSRCTYIRSNRYTYPNASKKKDPGATSLPLEATPVPGYGAVECGKRKRVRDGFWHILHPLEARLALAHPKPCYTVQKKKWIQKILNPPFLEFFLPCMVCSKIVNFL